MRWGERERKHSRSVQVRMVGGSRRDKAPNRPKSLLKRSWWTDKPPLTMWWLVRAAADGKIPWHLLCVKKRPLKISHFQFLWIICHLQPVTQPDNLRFMLTQAPGWLLTKQSAVIQPGLIKHSSNTTRYNSSLSSHVGGFWHTLVCSLSNCKSIFRPNKVKNNIVLKKIIIISKPTCECWLFYTNFASILYICMLSCCIRAQQICPCEVTMTFSDAERAVYQISEGLICTLLQTSHDRNIKTSHYPQHSCTVRSPCFLWIIKNRHITLQGWKSGGMLQMLLSKTVTSGVCFFFFFFHKEGKFLLPASV